MESFDFFDTNLSKTLKEEELYNLFEKMKKGDITARDEIICHNIKLVISEVNKRFSNTCYELCDLINIGLIGLIKGVDKFDIGRKIKFSSYATRCIDNEILMFLKKNKNYGRDISLDQVLTKYGENDELKIGGLYLLKEDDLDFVLEFENKELYKLIRNVVYRLPDREKNMIIKLFGFDGNQPLTQYQIAPELGVVQATVSRTLKKTLKYIKNELERLGVVDADMPANKIKVKNKN